MIYAERGKKQQSLINYRAKSKHLQIKFPMLYCIRNKLLSHLHFTVSKFNVALADGNNFL